MLRFALSSAHSSFLTRAIASGVKVGGEEYSCVPVAQIVEHGASNGKITGSIPRESKS